MKRIAAAAVLTMVLTGSQRLLVPKYTGKVVEGAFIQEYYQDAHTGHDVLFLGDCEVYENISPITLWEQYGITSYIRGSAQQLIAQSYYLLEDTLRYETPKVVVFNVSAMQEPHQVNETYNRMTMDGMRWSMAKLQAIEATKMESEHMIEYVFPLLRFHSRWSELEQDDFTYYFNHKPATHNGYYMRADIRPVEEFPTERRKSNYEFDPEAWLYLDRIRTLCEEKGIALMLMKAPSLYPTWYDQWDSQIVEYAGQHNIIYENEIQHIDEIGLDFTRDTYDGGLHMNVYGAEKLSAYMGKTLQEQYGLEDHRTEEAYQKVWAKKIQDYEDRKAAQEEEFRITGQLSQFS